MRLLEGDDSDSPGRNKSRQYFEGAGLSEANHSPDHKSDHMDVRPKEDYDEPWEWSAKQSLLLQTQIETGNIPPHFLTNQSQQANRTPQLSKRTVTAASSQGGGGEGAAASPDQEDGGLKPGASKEKMDVVEDTHYEVTTRPPDDPGEDNEGYTHLREEFGTIGPTPPDSLGRNSTAASTNNSTAQQEKQQSKEDASKVGNYEEPWDLQSKQKELEEKMRAASDRASKGGVDTGSPPHNADPRAQEGYEKPWDWKPHKKDDRTLEGMATISLPFALAFCKKHYCRVYCGVFSITNLTISSQSCNFHSYLCIISYHFQDNTLNVVVYITLDILNTSHFEHPSLYALKIVQFKNT